MDRLLLEGMVFFGRHGRLAAERELGQRFMVDVELGAELSAAGRGDRIQDTVDYTHAHDLVRQVVEGEPCELLECVAERIAERLLTLERVQRATVRVRKRPPLAGEFRAFGVEVTRGR